MFTVDRIENNIVVLEDRINNVMIDVGIELFNYSPIEGDIVDCVDNKYIKNEDITEKKNSSIRDRFNSLKK